MSKKENVILGIDTIIGSYLREWNPNVLSELETGKEYDTIYCACLSRNRLYINQNPEEDKKIIESLKSNLLKVKCERFVLVSTIYIHDENYLGQTEDPETWRISQEPYGFHRYEFELWVQLTFRPAYIIRLPEVFGLGNEDNILYKLINGKDLDHINLDSILQMYFLQWLMRDIKWMFDNNVLLLNAYSEPIVVVDIVKMFFPNLMGNCTSRTKVEVKHGSKHKQKTRIEILESICKYLILISSGYENYRKKNLAISNMMWEPEIDGHMFWLMKRYGIYNLELVPTRYGLWKSFTDNTVSLLNDYFKGHDINVIGFQSVLQGIPGTFLTNELDISDHLENVAIMAEMMGVRKILLGTPSKRNIPNNLSTIEGTQKIANALSKVARKINESNQNIILCIEPNSKKYGCDVGFNAHSLLDLICLMKFKRNISVGFDTGNAYMEEDTIISAKMLSLLIRHIQVSAPNFGSFSKTIMNSMMKYRDFIYNDKKDDVYISLKVNGSNINNYERVDSIHNFIEFFYYLPL